MPSMQKRIAIVTVLVIAAVGIFIYLQPDPGPCRQIRAACEAHGFRRGRTTAERRAFQENCFKPLLEGQAVQEFKVDEEVASACKQRQDKRRNRKQLNNNKKDEPEETPQDSQTESPDEEARAY